MEYRDGLLFTSIEITHNNKSTIIDNIVIDTGASYCILEPTFLEELDMEVSLNDELETFYGVNGAFSYIKRTAQSIGIGGKTIPNVAIYLGTVDDSINGLLGLDLLIKSNAIIDLNDMKIIFK